MIVDHSKGTFKHIVIFRHGDMSAAWRWLWDNIPGDRWRIEMGSRRFCFRNEEDAIWFQMIWSGA